MSARAEALWFGSGGAPPPVIAHTVAWNGLADSPHRTWAFRRAEQVAFTSTPFRCPNDLFLVMGHIRSLPPRTFGAERLSAIAARLVDKLRAPLAAFRQGSRVAAVLCLPERMGEANGTPYYRAQRELLRDRVDAHLRELGLDPVVHFVCRGHASLAFALLEAATIVGNRQVEAAIVGGLDTAYDPQLVQEAFDEGRIYDGRRVDSYCPGEGGALFLLARGGVARQLRWPALAIVEGASTAAEVGHLRNDVACTGAGLTAAANALGAHIRKERRTIDWWIHDVTNEHYRVHEMTLSMSRVAAGTMLPEAAFDGLHNHLGDLGAAAMPTAVAIACEGFGRGDPRADNCLVTGSSLFGDRGAVLVGRAPS